VDANRLVLVGANVKKPDYVALLCVHVRIHVVKMTEPEILFKITMISSIADCMYIIYFITFVLDP
jgi:hypothetical protein